MPRSRKTMASAPPMIPPTNLTGWKTKSAVLGAVAVALALAGLAAGTGEQGGARAGRPQTAGGKGGQKGAPGRGEAGSGNNKNPAPVIGVISPGFVKGEVTKV